ncbi:MAG: HAD hydrolase-like protein [Kiritimatiellae bacterium]|nr:HAD hydrolase-like protein [Kiritimatiellia bacterium]
MKTAIFDLDGTLVDSLADLALSINLTRGECGLAPLTLKEVAVCVGEGARVMVTRAFPEVPEAIDRLLLRQREHYRAHLLDNTVLYPGVQETLERLKAQGWALAVATNKPAAVTFPILEGLGILGLFGAVVGGGECPELKPDPAPLRLAAQRMGKALDAYDWMVGDHYTDLEAGRRAGIKRCFCRYGFGDARGETYELALDRLESTAFDCGTARAL